MITFSQLGKWGRMGNHLFELASCISYALDNGHQCKFPFWEYEQYFNLNDYHSDNIKPTIIYNEPNFHYTEIPLFPQNEIVDFRGFFQSYKYFDNNKDIIHGLLTPKIGFGIQHGACSIHVRRGDYLKLTKEYHQLDMTYYNAAMEMIKADRYLVFSDDIPWCKQNFIGNNITFIENNPPAVDVAIILGCENNIMSNSSFSWWASYLNKNPFKTVIAPKKWFGKALPHDTKDLLPPEWTQI